MTPTDSDERGDGTTPSTEPGENATPTDSGETDADGNATDSGGVATPSFPDHETTDLRVQTPDGDRLGSLQVAIAETVEEWTTGLSETDSLPSGWGMLFVSDSVEDHTFWMLDMDFGIDIVFADAEQTITGIHHAPEPGPGEDGTDQQYPGRGQYVLETPYRWTDHHDVTEGDRIEFDRS
ncbi:DUF192 domain-containing protein [Halovenus marina]|uniref:DUF192 domain-containing protein n=1 Tax=Halovenus marina TaxID=3396621 RepID=UPI003F547840